MNILSVTSVAVVTADPPKSRKPFMDALDLPLEGQGDGYYSSGSIPGSHHFGVWPLSEAAQACLGTPEWPAGRVVPQASIEFEVEDADAVAAAGEEPGRPGAGAGAAWLAAWPDHYPVSGAGPGRPRGVDWLPGRVVHSGSVMNG